MNELMLKIKDFGPIHYADIKIGKINIIAGQNVTGKSTASKILYSFLATLSNQGVELYNQKVKRSLGMITFEIETKLEPLSNENYSNLKKITASLNPFFLKKTLT